MSAAREMLPAGRLSETFDFDVEGAGYTATIGYYPDERPAEVFLNAAKLGGRADCDARDAAILVSFALQHSVAIDDLRRAMTRGPQGAPRGVIGTVLDILAGGGVS